jgi:hypothetical protein
MMIAAWISITAAAPIDDDHRPDRRLPATA